MLTKEQIFERAHEALHTPTAESISIGAMNVPITVAPNGCRQVHIHDIACGNVKIMAQNWKKSSPHAERARSGETLSWVIPLNEEGAPMNGWALIDTPVTTVAKGIVSRRKIH